MISIAKTMIPPLWIWIQAGLFLIAAVALNTSGLTTWAVAVATITAVTLVRWPVSALCRALANIMTARRAPATTNPRYICVLCDGDDVFDNANRVRTTRPCDECGGDTYTIMERATWERAT